MKTIKTRLCAFMLSVYMVFGVVSTDYLEVQAFEWVVPAIGIEEALKFLLGLLGVSIGAKVVGDNVDWTQLKDDCIQFQENQGNSSVAVSQWWSDVLSGSLDQTSSCWSAFKDWVYDLSVPDVPSSGVYNGVLSNLVDTIPDSSNLVYRPVSLGSENVSVDFGIYYVDSSGVLDFIYMYNNVSHVEVTTDDTRFRFKIYFSDSHGVNYMRRASYNYIEKNSFSASDTTINISKTDLGNYYIFGVALSSIIGLTSNIHPWNTGIISDSNFNIVTLDPSSIQAFQLALQDAISSAIPDVIPLPWDVLGDTTQEITDTIDSLIEQVNSGVLSISDYMLRIQELLGVLVVGADGVLYPTMPSPDNPEEDETLDDRVGKNQENQGFTLLGLEKVFPFCIPFDIYAFMTLLVAEPVAPVINWPVYNPITQDNDIITIDFSTWESVVVLFRYIFDFLFIIGLLLMARALIGGGDSA